MLRDFGNKVWRLILRIGFPHSIRLIALRKIGVRVGNDVYIGEGLTLAADLGKEHHLTLANRVSLAPNVNFILSAHPNNSQLKHLMTKYTFLNVQGSITVEHDAWIGMGAIILPNVRIGHHSIVGAGSVVTKNIPPYTVVVGSPARILRQLDHAN